MAPFRACPLLIFVAQLGKEGLRQQSIKCYLSAVRFCSIIRGEGDPFISGAIPVLQYVLRGVKRIPRAPAHTRLPITPAILRTIKTQLSSHAGDVDTVMLWAACSLGFFGFLREFTVRSAREFDPAVSLTLDDVAVDRHDDPSLVKNMLKCSKTDPFGHGVDIFLCRTHSVGQQPVVNQLPHPSTLPGTMQY